jgi:hypothetical protein
VAVVVELVLLEQLVVLLQVWVAILELLQLKVLLV